MYKISSMMHILNQYVMADLENTLSNNTESKASYHREN